VAPSKKVKEADSVKIAAFPEPIQFRGWKASVRTEITAAAGPGRCDAAFSWLLKVENASFNDLANSGHFRISGHETSCRPYEGSEGRVGPTDHYKRAVYGQSRRSPQG
jgi:hypothetical protein